MSQLVRSRKGFACSEQQLRRLAVTSYESVEQSQPSLKTELLASDTVHQGLEDRWEPWRPHAAKPDSKIIEARILIRNPVKRREIDVEPKHPIQYLVYESVGSRGCCSGHVNAQAGSIHAPNLGHRKLDRSISRKYHSPVGGTVPSVNLIDWAAPERPHREVQPKWRLNLNEKEDSPNLTQRTCMPFIRTSRSTTASLCSSSWARSSVTVSPLARWRIWSRRAVCCRSSSM